MTWINGVEWMARLILALLFGLSIWSLSIILERRKFYQQFIHPTDDLNQKLILPKSFNIADLPDCFLKEVIFLVQGFRKNENLDSALSGLIALKKNQFEKGLSILATLGSTTPFIGLLGTILGIIVSFEKLSSSAGGTNEVMISLAEALILTAMGLVVAIPSVIGFNYYSKKSKKILQDALTAKNLYLAYQDKD